MGNISTNGTITAKNFIGSATGAFRLMNYYSTRPTTLNISTDGSGGVIQLKATSSLTSGAGDYNGHVLHFYWDNTGKYDSQLLIPNFGVAPIQFRNQNGGTWTDWMSVITTASGGIITTSSGQATIGVHNTSNSGNMYMYDTGSTRGIYTSDLGYVVQISEGKIKLFSNNYGSTLPSSAKTNEIFFKFT